jgi:hypothetical protein
MRKLVLFIFAGIVFNSLNIFSQVSTGELPPSFSSKVKSAIKSEFVAKPDLDKLRAEDVINDQSNRPYRVAQMIDVDYCISNAGKWDTLSSGERIWRLNIYSPDAQGLQFNYSNFHLPTGARLFIYSADKSFVKGAFTAQNNDPSGNFATEIIPGESCIVELALSPYTQEQPSFCISQIGYVYRGVDFYIPEGSRLKASGACQVNVNCSPEGDNWKDVKRAVARIYMSGYYCSGTLVNNTAQDFKNYFTTAFHCIDGIINTSSNWLFYFNYERSGCSNTSTLITPNTITGASVKAKTPINGGGDGALLLLNGTIPSTYNVYYAGWDRRDSAVSGGASIHHPAGDRKKIATIRDKWYSATWHGENNVVGAKNAHWYVIFAQTANGHSVSEGGSSGSGIFGNDELYRGSLSGGNSSCDIPSGSNLFGKLAYNWDKYGSTADNQFKTWLDPSNTGAVRLRGIDPNNATAFNVYWTSSPAAIDIDSFVRFRDETPGTGLTRKWTFQGGEPSISTEANPVVRYGQPGVYDVTLEITRNGTKYTKLRTQYVYVKSKSAWIQQNTRFPMPERGVQGISIVDSLHVWAWVFDGIEPTHQITEYTVTADGGKTWQPDSIVSDTLKGYGIGNIYALSKDTIYATVFGPNGGGKVLRSRDGGNSWTVQTTAKYSAPKSFPNFVYFFNKDNGIACGDPTNGYFEIYHTTDGGENWARVPKANIPDTMANETGTVNMYDAQGDTIWFGTGAGRVFRSVNQGENWSVTSTGLTGQTTVRFRNSKVGFAIAQGSNYAVKKTVNGGDTWSNYTLPPYFLKGDLVYVPGTRATWLNVSSGYPSGSSYTTNDGLNFSPIDVSIQYTTVAFYDEFTGWAGSFNIDANTGGIYKWDKKNPLLTDVRDVTGGARPSDFVELYPNPVESSGIIAIKGDYRGGTAYIYNLQGKLVRSFSILESFGGSTQNFDFSGLLSGVYILQLVSKDRTDIIRFIKL